MTVMMRCNIAGVDFWKRWKLMTEHFAITTDSDGLSTGFGRRSTGGATTRPSTGLHFVRGIGGGGNQIFRSKARSVIQNRAARNKELIRSILHSHVTREEGDRLKRIANSVQVQIADKKFERRVVKRAWIDFVIALCFFPIAPAASQMAKSVVLIVSMIGHPGEQKRKRIET